MKCASCGFESNLNESFIETPRSFSRKTKLLCPSCWLRRDYLVHSVFLWGGPIALLLGLGLALVAPGSSAGALLMNCGALVFASVVFIVWHELGHALAAKLVGFRVFRIEIGSGRILWAWKLWGFRWIIHALPMGGFAYAAARSARAFRIRQIIFVLGGPVSNGLLVVALFPYLLGGEQLFTGRFDGFDPVRMIWLINLADVLFTLWPHLAHSSRGVVPNDGLIIWRTLTGEYKWLKEHRVDTTVSECDDLAKGHKHQEAFELVERALMEFPDDLSLLYCRASLLIGLRRLEAALAAFRSMLGIPGLQLQWRAISLNNLAYTIVLLDDRSLLPVADDYSSEAMKLAGWIPHLKGTRGEVLVELGRFTEASELLWAAYREHEEAENRAINLAYLSKSAYLQNEPLQAMQLITEAQRLDPQNDVVARISMLVGHGSQPQARTESSLN